MITPRQTKLIRVADLQAFRSALVDAVVRGLADGRDTVAVLVPTRGAARHVARRVPDGVSLVTRDELYDHLHRRLANPPRRLTALEREVVMHAAARAAAIAHEVPFRLRPGLIAEMLRFYDQLRRQTQQVDRFEALLDEALGGGAVEIDRGAERLRVQTQFLAAAFREYENRVRVSSGCDEHQLRERLIAEPAMQPLRHVVVTVADWIAGADGLYVADFDLLARLPELATIDIISTEGILGSGFHERLHNWWPGLDEQRFTSDATTVSRPHLITPADARSEEPWWTYRDREEELVGMARQLKADRRAGEPVALDRVAIVYKQPLPYLYLAREVFGSAGIRFQSADALPLAAEPTSAALDLVLDAVSSTFTRTSLVALLRAPQFRFTASDPAADEVAPESIHALDRAFSDARYLGTLEHLERLPGSHRAFSGTAAPALAAAVLIARELAPLAEPDDASAQLRRIVEFWTRWARPLTDDPDSRERRARSAIGETLTALLNAHASYDDPQWTVDDAALAIRRAIGEQTFEIPQASHGLQLLDDRAARYGDFDTVAIVGVVDSAWPERPHRNIFYPPAILKALGWPSERDRRAAADAHFLDLLASARRRTLVSVFTLDDDSIVSRSIQLDEIPRARLSTVARSPDAHARVFVDEALSLAPTSTEPLDEHARVWAAMRTTRSDATGNQFHGAAGPLPPRVLSVSALEVYLTCPFKFFAQYVMKLQEEPDDEEVMDPRREGEFVHKVFEEFFREWQSRGHRGITVDLLDAARSLFADVVEKRLADLPEAEAGLQRTRLLGSPAAAGLGEAVMRMEAERPVPVVERLLEYKLEGPFTFATADGPRTVTIRGKADRLDLLADGTFRLIDYKLGWPPDKSLALQLPIYGLSAEQQLARERARRWTLGEAAYVAFKGPRRVVPLFRNDEDRSEVLADAQQRLIETVDKIAAGEFPPTPLDVFHCERCSFAAVCRKDYVGDV